MLPILVAVSGRIASGKSTVAYRLAELLGCPRSSFGEYVRAVVASRGLKPHRENLQAVGDALINSGWEPFCRAVLMQSGWQPGRSLVVEGVRHVEAVHQLRNLVAPSSLFLIHLQVDEELRQKRFSARGGDSGAVVGLHDSHPTEREVGVALPLIANLVLDGARPIDELAEAIIDFVGTALSAGPTAAHESGGGIVSPDM